MVQLALERVRIRHLSGALRGRVAIVAGEACDHTRAIALALAEAGVAVAIVAPLAEWVASTADTIRARGSIALGVASALDDETSADRLIAHAEQRLGPIDALVVRSTTGAPALRERVLPSMAARGIGRVIEVRDGTDEPRRGDPGGAVLTLRFPLADTPERSAEAVLAALA